MAGEEEAPQTRSSTVATSSVSRESPPPSAAVRQRLPQRQKSPNLTSQPSKPSLGRRRSSMLSYSSLEEVTNVLTDDIINPSMSRPRASRAYDEVTHWHSTPLAFAMLPAIGGLLFKNGSAFMTDVLLLVLAAIFMNWSIRLPWDWYYSAQAQRRDIEAEEDVGSDDETDETAVESASSANGSPKPTTRLESSSEPKADPHGLDDREQAAAELRRLELLALLATFVFPLLTAYLLHVIRGQLSQSSTGLVSDYNLSVFLLAAEIRPCRQLIRLVTNRTLHLQRTVTGLDDPRGSAAAEKDAISHLKNRIAEVETKLTDHTVVPQSISLAQKQDVSELSAEMRKRYEPRFEGLERAVRRYEKRFTTLAMVTEQRLTALDARVKDAVSLAAAAAQQSQTKGPMAKLLDSIAAVILWPLKLAYGLAMSPLRVTEDVYKKSRALLFGSTPARVEKRSGSKSRAVQDEKAKERSMVRKPSR